MFLTVINCLVQIGLHWLNYTRPNEQRQIVRLILFPLMFGVCNFLSLWQYPASPYLTQLAEFYEIIALVGMFLLLCYYVCPDPANFESYFAHLERLGWRRRVVHEDGSLRWFYWRWIALYQVSMRAFHLVHDQKSLRPDRFKIKTRSYPFERAARSPTG